MAQTQAPKLDAGMPFPDLPVRLLDGTAAGIKAALAGSWSVVLLYRGRW